MNHRYLLIEMGFHPKCTLLWLILWSVARSSGRSTTGSTSSDVDTCYVSHAGCKYRVVVRPAPGADCGMSNDDPDTGTSNNLPGGGYRSPIIDPLPPMEPSSEIDLAASVRKIENLEQTLIRMMEGLSQRSLRHIRQIKTDLRHMSETMNLLKAKSNSIANAPLMSSSANGGGQAGVLGGGGSGTGVGRKGSSPNALVCPTEFIGGGTWPSCYRFSTFNASWHEAREYCNAFGANLVSLDTVKEAYIVDYLLKSTPEYQDAKGWWTSGNYIVRSQKWMWTSRQYLRPIGYSRWAPGEPNARSTMHCLLLYKLDKYQWHDGTCTDKHAFVCEIELHV